MHRVTRMRAMQGNDGFEAGQAYNGARAASKILPIHGKRDIVTDNKSSVVDGINSNYDHRGAAFAQIKLIKIATALHYSAIAVAGLAVIWVITHLTR